MGKKFNEAMAIIAAIGSFVAAISKLLSDEFGSVSFENESDEKEEKES